MNSSWTVIRDSLSVSLKLSLALSQRLNMPPLGDWMDILSVFPTTWEGHRGSWWLLLF